MTDDPEHGERWAEDLLRQGIEEKDVEAVRQAGALLLELRNTTSLADPRQPHWTRRLLEVCRTAHHLTGDLSYAQIALHLDRQIRAETRAAGDERLQRLTAAAHALLRRYDDSGSVVDLESAVESATQALADDDHPGRAELLHTLGVALHRRFAHRGDLADLRRSVETLTAAVAVVPEGNPDESRFGVSLRAAMRELHGHDPSQPLEPAIRRSVDEEPPEPPAPSATDAVALLERADRTGDTDALAAAIELLDGSDEPGDLTNLGIALRMRFGHTGNPADLDAAVDTGRRAVDRMPADNRMRYVAFAMYGAALGTRYEHTGSGADLVAAVDAGRQAAQMLDDDDPAHTRILFGHVRTIQTQRPGGYTSPPSTGRMLPPLPDPAAESERRARTALDLHIRAQALGDLAVLEPAAELARTADDPHMLSVILHTRHQMTGEPADLAELVDVTRSLVAEPDPGDPNAAGRHTNLAGALYSLFEAGGDPAVLDEAVAAARRAVELGDGTDQLPALRHNLANMLSYRYERTHTAADRDEALAAAAHAIADPGHRDCASCSETSGRLRHDRFEESGDPAELDRLVETLAGRLRHADGLTDEDRALTTLNLATALRLRYQRRGVRSDLSAAVDVLRDPGADSEHRAAYLVETAILWRLRLEAGDHLDLARLDAVVHDLREVLRSLPPGSARREGTLTTLGLVLMRCFEHSGMRKDIDAAVTAFDAAARLGEQVGSHLGLGLALMARHRASGDPGDLDTAIAAGRRAVAMLPDGHPERTQALCNLAVGLHRRNADGDRAAAREAWTAAASDPAGATWARLRSVRGWASCLTEGDGPAAAVEVYALGVELLGLLAWPGLARGDQQHLLEQEESGLARDAAAAAVAGRDPGRATGFLDNGRGLLWAQALRLRTELDLLHRARPELATALARTRVALGG
ncbi:hypothetical protein [Actinoplanes flavus]|uniref:Tetratricopeptide repeat protein n=1 Tax=Actinoplanes flavus TaxID=2820290 RepID=A0ABS3UTD6_9ACTN|nr:hypothetical protein [Actinoplanes flavus]MBO3741842.1 hypothetical protein [Actinoplanes flavus]